VVFEVAVAIAAVALVTAGLRAFLGGEGERDSRPVGAIEDLLALRDRADLNVLFVLVDTLRADRLGSYGYERDTVHGIVDESLNILAEEIKEYVEGSDTVSGRPPNGLPFKASTAAVACASVDISTNAKPRGRPVSRSMTIFTSSTWPPSCSKSVRSCDSVVW